MLSGYDPSQLAVLLLVAVAVGVGVLAVALPLLSPSGVDSRIKGVIPETKAAGSDKQFRAGRLMDGRKDNRRKQVQETLRQIDARARQKKGVPLRVMIGRAGLSLTVPKFWLMSIGTGAMLALLPVLIGFPLYVGVLSGIAATFGVPRWFLSALAKRRQKSFLEEMPDAIDVMVRGLKAGLPLSDAMRVIATESGPPLGPEFLEVVEGQRLGITMDQGLERMFDRMPLPEVSFLGIVISIQSKTGGNLSEALGNLSRVLRERKKLKGKIRSMSQEAKSSAAIIGSLPFLIVVALLMVSPEYLEPLFSTPTGHLILVGCGAWMVGGILVMRSMINFDF
jgi:tight adherence protein B